MAINSVAHVPIQWTQGKIARVVTQNLSTSDFTKTSNAGFIGDPVGSQFLPYETCPALSLFTDEMIIKEHPPLSPARRDLFISR